MDGFKTPDSCTSYGSDIGAALAALKYGLRVARKGWNGKDMWLSLTPGSLVAASNFWSPANRVYAQAQPNNQAEVLPYVTMKTADGKIVPWLCSQTDLLADDWFVL